MELRSGGIKIKIMEDMNEVWFDFNTYSRWIPTREEIKKLRDLLDEALKPRYKVKTASFLDVDKISYYYVYDTNPKSKRGHIATFYTNTGLNAKEEAEQLCKKLNKEC